MKFPILIGEDDVQHRVNIQIWDCDLLSFNDFIADATFTFEHLAEDAWVTNRRVKRTGPVDRSIFKWKEEKDDTKFWIECQKRNK
jgi:hypothetical protein